MSFHRIASFPFASGSEGAKEASSEIITASGDSMTQVYSDTFRVLVPPSLAGELTEPARVDAMLQNTARGTRRS